MQLLEATACCHDSLLVKSQLQKSKASPEAIESARRSADSAVNSPAAREDDNGNFGVLEQNLEVYFDPPFLFSPFRFPFAACPF